ncbi:Peptidyl-prolyl cis-trans isomerase PTPA-1 [Hyphodiscus hymeniophilus]|uniref:Serine/threonine-protein phosphatase 2A activator n=1 Tax=Hyphodiscus hymeniophilus TaxID=353542 RepID=A0A9P6SND8_9HELO|nr:Peptidyl-prolyl cis-trans isomerase PTPA-1 [Hyphodiscus hymeniophilus]
MSLHSQNLLQTQASSFPRSLSILDPNQPHSFVKPVKRINEGHDVPAFLTSQAYRDIGIFVMQLNISMCPRKVSSSSPSTRTQTWALDTPIKQSEPVHKLQELLQSIDAIIEETPPDTGPRRFGNVSFRKWYDTLESRVQQLLEKYLPNEVLNFRTGDGVGVLDELTPYLMGGFGSAQRLDYGTGHELSFLAFLGCIWKLGGFTKESSSDGSLERSIVIGVVEPYLRVIRRLILTYTLEPAGSHGVWGLDDHSFIPYILGSSQNCPAISDDESMPVEGSLPGAPNPEDIAKMKVVDKERKRNMYFSAVGFINDVKTGPFWEHSPILFDISGIRSGWGKINKGMIKMYNAEVLSKFPVVQHFPFGSLFNWEHDPNASPATHSVHTANHPASQTTTSNASAIRYPPQEGTKAPWAQATGASMAPTVATWANQPPGRSLAPTSAPWVNPASGAPQTALPPTRAPWASQSTPGTGQLPIRQASPDVPTRAPRGDQGSSGRR